MTCASCSRAHPPVGRGLCGRCYKRHKAAGTLDEFPRFLRARDEVLAEWDFIRRDGLTVPQAAARMGMSVDALFKALERAKRAGDPRAVFTWAGAKETIRGARR